MKIHEYQGKEILRSFGVPVPRGIPAFTEQEAVEAAQKLGGPVWVVKAQIHAGGRGKGGGVKLARSVDEVKQLAGQCDLVIVVGSPNSSNSNRLREVAMNRGVKAYLVDGADEIRPEWLSGKQHVGVTAGASAPEVLVRQVVDRVTEMGARSVIQLEGNPEHVVFPLPKELQRNGE